MALGKIVFEGGREVELLEVLDDLIVIERILPDGSTRQYRLKKESSTYEQVADQVDELVSKANGVKETEEVEKPKAEKPKAEKPKAEKPKAEDEIYDWSEIDEYQNDSSAFEDNIENANDAAVYLFTETDESKVSAVTLFLNSERIFKNYIGMVDFDVNELHEAMSNYTRPEKTNYIEVLKILLEAEDSLFKNLTTKELGEKLAPFTSLRAEKSVVAIFNRKLTSDKLSFLPRRYSNLIDISRGIYNKLYQK